MDMLIKKKQLLTATLVLALGAAVAVNWYYSGTVTKTEDNTSTVNQQVQGNLGDSLYVAGTTDEAEQEETTLDEENDEQVNKISSISAQQKEYFSNAKLERTQAHDEVIDNINETLENKNLSESQKKKIEENLKSFEQNVKAEVDSENLITAKTSSECIVIINNDTAQVIMQEGTLNETITLQISEIIKNTSSIDSENLTIIEAK